MRPTCTPLRAGLGLALLILALPLLTPPAAAGPVGKPASNLELGRPELPDPSILRGDQRISAVTGVPLALYNVGFPVSPGDPAEMALEYLAAHRDLFRLRQPDLSDLVTRAIRRGPAGTTVRLEQWLDGVPVRGAEITITFDRRGRVSFVMNGYQPDLSLPGTTPRVSAGDARQAALDYLGMEGDLNFDRTRLEIYPEGGGRLAWQVHLAAVGEPVGDWEVLVDALSGEFFRVTDVALYAPVDGTGTVFDADPLSSARATYGDPGFSDGSDADTAELTAQRFSVVLRDIDLSGGTYSLTGPFAAIVDSESPKKGTFSQASPDFSFTRTQDGFEAVNTYYHIDNIMRWVNVDLGLAILPYQYSGGVRFDPHGLNGADNSHYSSSTGQVAFGEGGVDDAEDADVVIHELGHGLHDWVTSGSLSQVEGLSEGFGDYLAASYSRSLAQWTPADPPYHWVFNWDGHNPFWNGRITNYGAVYPSGLVGQIHTDGQIWSTCNMKIWDAIGRMKIDQAMLAGLGMTNSGSNQQDAAQAVLQAAVNLGYPAADLATMESIYQGCGYSVSLPSVCGNGVREGSEECDGADLGGASCADVACNLGSPSCTASCTLDYSACSDCSQCNFDGVCDLGEDCNGCPADCISGTSGATCGNGLCEAADGEDCTTCAADCAGQTSGNPNNRFCCGFGDGLAPNGCGDSRCTSGGFACTETPGTPVSFCCGDLTCEGAETSANCGVDCTGGCFPTGSACSVDGDCCSNKCRGGSCR